MSAAERRQAILETLCIRRHETRENLAFEFGVSKRTIEYDILSLSLTYPIYTTQGNGGGIHVVDGFYLDKPCLNEKEIALLLKILPTLTGEDSKTMSGIIRKYGGLKK
jgi:predicted DNA-binding transcriptional regulator YafY